ncbi:MAG: PAS domain S-box protein [Deltaproteobacteria bacterium]|nr:PAS domain S-box protein [Deltaproteobacteria bacterium]
MKKTQDTSKIESLESRLDKKNREIRELKKINMFLASLYDGISEEIMVIDNDFIICDVNMAFLKKCGLSKKDVVGKKCYEVKRQTWLPCITYNEQCPVKSTEKTGESVETTISYEDKDGNAHEYIMIIYPLKAEDESRKYFLEITRDVTEYRYLNLKLQRSEKRFKAILDTATDAIISIDENHNIILFNNAAQRIFGYSGQEVIGKNLNTIIPSGYGSYQEYLDRVIEECDSDIIGKTFSLNAMRKNGEIFPVDISLSLLSMGGKETFTAIIRDITRQRQMERKMLQSERLAAVGQAVSHVAHEIKNPLMIIGGFTSQIRSALEREKDINKIDMVLEEVARLERLIANLGDFTKEYKLVMRPAELNSVIGDVLNILSGIYDDNKFRFEKSFSCEINEINCDPDKLKQVFINIISNGTEAMPSGGTITIKTEKINRGIEISISDQGRGMTNEELNKIFEPFYTTREKGTGLGLAISYKIIQAHNGDIWAASEPGKGTTFIIQIPNSY